MPMAHNVPPVIAEATDEAGVFRAQLRLEMLGVWVLRLQITGAVRDLIVKRFEFGGRADRARHSIFEGYKERYTGFADQRNEGHVARGKFIFNKFCAACHGIKLEGEMASGATVPDNEVPAPSLNGTGHSHHHADGELFGVVKHGPSLLDDNRPSRMPAFDRILPDDDIWAAIAYIKSMWPIQIQARHAKIYPTAKRATKAE
jgi:mono/diheme cytochrome c family protein